MKFGIRTNDVKDSGDLSGMLERRKSELVTLYNEFGEKEVIIKRA